MPERADAVVEFWSGVGPSGWYGGGADLDAEIRQRFLPLWEEARAGGLRDWLSRWDAGLAYLILTDQFPRNMFRDDARAFATDQLGRDAALAMIWRNLDLRADLPIRQFFYLPFMHAENTIDQDRCVCLMLTRMGDQGEDNLRHARAHRQVIRRFGRFPYRNAALGRVNTPQEEAFLAAGGYAQALRDLDAA